MKRMTRQDAIDIINKVAKHEDLCSAICFWWSPLSNTVEEVHIYADAYSEVLFWAEAKRDLYKGMGLPFIIYVNGEAKFTYGNLADHLPEEEE